MGFPRGNDAIVQQLQEDRLAKLCDDNAFVNVAEVLRRQRRDGAPGGVADVDMDFLEPSASPTAVPPRIHLSRFLLEQHRAYLKALEEEQREEKKEGGASAPASSSASVVSSVGDVLEAASERGKRLRGIDHRCGEGMKRTRKEPHGEDEYDDCSSSGGGVEKGAVVAGHLGREYRSLRAWLQSRRLDLTDTPAVAPGFMAMTAPPPAHTGGYHLCSVCLLPANYKCVRCRRALFCSIECHVVHEATRCMKFIV
ncbi:hypothetical protein DQ04_12281000 [Trypanosoma grayi]|uniref:hypothetical protein n=1 Tax=Trypanosoma grayi TaxID=71804 RepID=UPI0004F4004B|nr:hypothetical protein DQ04_12281000 [Trypanosoma grayi]KEG06778.1 hypothetical protein DQ04_12281000 [Trypanosoma grayi]